MGVGHRGLPRLAVAAGEALLKVVYAIKLKRFIKYLYGATALQNVPCKGTEVRCK